MTNLDCQQKYTEQYLWGCSYRQVGQCERRRTHAECSGIIQYGRMQMEWKRKRATVSQQDQAQVFLRVVLTHGHQATASIACQGGLTPDSHLYHWSSFFWGFYLLRLTSLWSSSLQILTVWLSFLWPCKPVQ